MERSFYFLYFSTPAGGASIEWDLTVNNKLDLEKAVKSGIVSSFPFLMRYGAKIDLIVVENSKIKNKIDVFKDLSCKVEGIGALSYNSDSFILEPLSNKLETNEKINEIIDIFYDDEPEESEQSLYWIYEALKNKLQVNFDFDRLKVPDLSMNLLKKGEELNYEDEEKFDEEFLDLFSVVSLGSKIYEAKTVEDYFAMVKEDTGFDVDDFF